MFCASVVYSETDDSFDADYFRDHHAPMFARLLGDNCVRFEVHEAIAAPGAPPPPYRSAAYFWVTSAEEFGRTLSEHGAGAYADIPRFSRQQPVRGWARVVGQDRSPTGVGQRNQRSPDGV